MARARPLNFGVRGLLRGELNSASVQVRHNRPFCVSISSYLDSPYFGTTPDLRTRARLDCSSLRSLPRLCSNCGNAADVRNRQDWPYTVVVGTSRWATCWGFDSSGICRGIPAIRHWHVWSRRPHCSCNILVLLDAWPRTFSRPGRKMDSFVDALRIGRPSNLRLSGRAVNKVPGLSPSATRTMMRCRAAQLWR
jgi:hypothetical protein